MKINISFLVLSLLFCFAICGDEIVEYTTPVFVHGEGGYPCLRIPAIVQTKSGKLLAFAECRTFTGDGCNPKNNYKYTQKEGVAPNALKGHMCMKTSTDLGKTWSNLTFPFGKEAWQDDPEPVYDENANAVIFPIMHEINGKSVVYQRISYDEGETWVEEQDLTPYLTPYQSTYPGPGAGVMKEFEPHKGRLLFIGHYGAYGKDIVWYSDDHGKTYKRAEYTFPQMDEAMLVELSNGTMMANLRNYKKWGPYRAVSISKDGGETWTEVRPEKQLIDPVCQGSIIRNGKNLYFSNVKTENSRTNMTVSISKDDGETWKTYVQLTKDNSAYSCLTKVGKQDHIGLLYEKDWENCSGHACVILFAYIKTDDGKVKITPNLRK